MTASPAPENRKPTGRFQPGQSGNPGGRPKGVAALAREQIKDDPARLLNVFLQIAENPAAKDSDRITAAERYLDRAYGKAPQHAPVEGEDPLELIDHRIIAVLDELESRRESKATRGSNASIVAGDSKS